MTLTITDLFCGFGGSSAGAVDVGLDVKIAANHWQLAIEAHQLNHPTTDHLCADISDTDPRWFPRTDILWASPSCTNHSVARGVRRVTGQGELFGEAVPDEAAERSRATMWDVPRFVEAMLMRGKPYEFVVVENVVDAARWMYWPAWLMAMDAAGYDHHVVWLNSMFAHGKDWLGAPQSRDRIYVVFWRKGAPKPDLDIRPDAWCPRCNEAVPGVQTWKRADERWGRYRAQYVYLCPRPRCGAVLEPWTLPAAVAIDWDNLGQRIGDRKKPLAAATRARIAAGLARYGRPLVSPAGGTWNEDARPVDEPFRARTARENDGLACPPLMVPVEARDGLRARPASEPLRAMTTRNETGVAIPPFVAILRGQSVTSPASEPLTTVSAGGGHHGVVTPPDADAEPFVTVLRNNCDATSTAEPLSTVAAAGNHHALTVPGGFVMRNNTARGDQGQMATPFVEAFRTITTTGHQSVVTSPDVPDAVLVPYYGNGTARHVAEAMNTVTTKDRNALVKRPVAESEVDDCTFRMLEPDEIRKAMAFDDDYQLIGNKREKVRGLGNAVTPPAARLILERLLAAHGSAV